MIPFLSPLVLLDLTFLLESGDQWVRQSLLPAVWKLAESVIDNPGGKVRPLCGYPCRYFPYDPLQTGTVQSVSYSP